MSLENTWLKEFERENSKKTKGIKKKRGWKSFKFRNPKIFSELNGLSVYHDAFFKLIWSLSIPDPFLVNT